MGFVKSKLFNKTTLLVGLFASINLVLAQKNLYGSNNGSYVTVNDANLYYEEYGEGATLILLHGGLGSISNFKYVIPELSEHFKVLAIDSPGHGRSEQIDSLSYNIMADHIATFIDKLELDNVSILGYSDGAIVGVLASYLRPDKVKKLIFGAGALSPYDSKPEGLEMLKNFSSDMLPSSWEENYRQKSPNPDYWEQFIVDSKNMWLEEVWVPREILSEIKSKVLILFGDRDQFIPLKHALEIYKLIPNAELGVLPNIPHEMFNYPKVVNPIILNFLSRE